MTIFVLFIKIKNEMKKIVFLAALAVMLLASCAENKTFEKSDGTTVVAVPYGWMDKEHAIDGVQYQICTPNFVLSVILCETIAAPVLLTGLELWEPVSYTEPNTTK